MANRPNGAIYIGFANDLTKRVIAHKNKMVKGFTSRYNITLLVYFEEHETSYEAFQRERQMKKWKRQWKIELIEKMNPEWRDLAADWEW